MAPVFNLVICLIIIVLCLWYLFYDPAIPCDNDAGCPTGFGCYGSRDSGGYCAKCNADTKCPDGTTCWQGMCVSCNDCYNGNPPTGCPAPDKLCDVGTFCGRTSDNKPTCYPCPRTATEGGGACPTVCKDSGVCDPNA